MRQSVQTLVWVNIKSADYILELVLFIQGEMLTLKPPNW